MKLQITALPESNTLRLVGDLDLYNAEMAREAFLNQWAEMPGIELDLAGVESCDTAGMQLLLATRSGAEASGKPFWIQTPSPAVERCGELLGLQPETWRPHRNR
jgi:anti-anti-sigma factor